MDSSAPLQPSKKENAPPRRRSSRRAAISPIMKPGDELLRHARNDIELRKLGVNSLSHDPAAALLSDKSEKAFTVCGWPSGKKTNAEYEALLTMKDQFEIFFFLCHTSPEICLADAKKFLFDCMAHYLRGAIAKEIADGFAPETAFIGSPPMPFQKGSEVDYIGYLRWVNKMGDDDDKHNYELIMYRAELSFQSFLASRGFTFVQEHQPFSQWLRGEAERYYYIDRIQRNREAHFFTSFLQVQNAELHCKNFEDLPPSKSDLMADEYELGKRVFALESLKAQRESRDTPLLKAACFLIETFMSEKVERQREVAYGESHAMIPGKLPPNQGVLKM